MSSFSCAARSLAAVTFAMVCAACFEMESDCASRDDCRRGQFCEYAPGDGCGSAEGAGVCRAIPRSCPAQYEPVCGCDGRTYPNACAAQAAATSLASEGACETPADAGQDAATDAAPPDTGVEDAQEPPTSCGAPGDPACVAGWFCNFERAAGGQGCGTAGARGVCEPLPTQCSEATGPVCGCDGRIYEHACDAHARGISVREEGGCEERACGYPVPGHGDEPVYCAADERCHRPEPVGRYGGCSVVAPVGVCHVTPKLCPQTLDPVCGCFSSSLDGGYTFRNACQAHAQGHDVSAEAACGDPRPACGRNLPCSEGELCECRFQAFCAEGETNWCLERSAVGPFAPEIYLGRCIAAADPCSEGAGRVCGCDRNDYASACAAARAGVQIVSDGTCAARACGASSDCDPGQFCDRSGAGEACAGPGTCRALATTCSDENAPVCSCSGASYLNECWARASGESVARAGKCEPDALLPCAGPLETPCPEGHVCARDCGASSAGGQCQPIETCAETRELVCGCDGVTYQNACAAWRSGTMLARQEPCRVCTSLGDARCTSTEVCNPLAGFCEPLQEQCPDLGEPVCGCDLRTYASACHALQNGVTIRGTGACPAFGATCSADDPSACTEREFCNAGDLFYTERCGPFEGVCEAKPTTCPPPEGPRVCMSTGFTRASACVAHSEGFITVGLGLCGYPFGRCGFVDGWGYLECADDEFCAPNDPWCGNDIFSQLTCYKVPASCEGVQGDPVCTCAGLYPNACEAARAHTTPAAREPVLDENGVLIGCGPIRLPR